MKELSAALGDITERMVNDYSDQIHKAILKTEGAFSLKMGYKITPDGPKTKIEANLSFVESQVKDSATIVLDDTQPTLFDKVEETHEEEEAPTDLTYPQAEPGVEGAEATPEPLPTTEVEE